MKLPEIYKHAMSVQKDTTNADSFDVKVAAVLLHTSKPKAFVPTGRAGVDRIVQQSKAPIRYDVPHGHNTTPYTDTRDATIHMPHPESFISADEYARVLLHELAHYAGIPLGRKINRLGFTQLDMPGFGYGYATEEITAEIAVQLVSQAVGLPATEEQYSYIKGYIQALQSTHDLSPFVDGLQGEVDAQWDKAVTDGEETANYLLKFLDN